MTDRSAEEVFASLPAAEVDMLAQMRADMAEELLPELASWVDETSFGPALRSPIVYQVPLYSPGSANRQYLAKLAALEAAQAEGDWSTCVYLRPRPYRLEALLELRDDMEPDEWLELAGGVWTDSENIWQNAEKWRDLIDETDDATAFMNDDEVAAFVALPDEVTVYRGAVRGQNEDGLSWTLSRERAEWFANRFDTNPVVLTATVSRDEVFAVILRRSEDEVILRSAPERSTA